jgi:hypothetical protein
MESPRISLLIIENDQHNTNKSVTYSFFINSYVVCYFLLHHYFTIKKKIIIHLLRHIDKFKLLSSIRSTYLVIIERTFGNLIFTSAEH